MGASGKSQAPVKAPVWQEHFTTSFAPNGAAAPTEVDAKDGFSVTRTAVGTFECVLGGIGGAAHTALVSYSNPPANGAALVASTSASNGSLVVTIKTQTSGADADHTAAAHRKVNLLLVVKP